MKLSNQKRDKIKEQILSVLFHIYPKTLFTSNIAEEVIRDEEFIKDLMFELKNKNLVAAIRKNPKGKYYSRRIRWRLSRKAYQAYKKQ